VSLPSKESTDSNGKRHYFDALGFTDAETGRRFKTAALAAFLIPEQEQQTQSAPQLPLDAGCAHRVDNRDRRH
jgi:hypothetical protein